MNPISLSGGYCSDFFNIIVPCRPNFSFVSGTDCLLFNFLLNFIAIIM